MHGSFSDAPEVTAVWDDILCWMRGETLPVAKAPASPSELADLVAEFSTDDIGGEARRMGCAYLVGRLAGGGSTEALVSLEAAIRGAKGVGKMVSDVSTQAIYCCLWLYASNLLLLVIEVGRF